MFTFNINDNVIITVSGEGGVIIGRAEFQNCDNQYLIRYEAGDGRAQESWWHEDALTLG